MTDQPKRGRGRPRVEDAWANFVVRLRQSDVERIKAACAPLTPSEWARLTLLDKLTPREPTPAQMAPVRAATVEKIERAFGPVKSAPGARLKGLKHKNAQ